MTEASAILVLAHRDFVKLLRDRPRIIADFSFPLIFIGILGTGLQAGFGERAGINLLDFVFTGVLAQAVWQSSAMGIISLVADREQDFSQAIFVSPISRSATSEMMPIADDCHTACASTPVKTKSRRLMPARSPKPACKPVPRMPMKMSGKEKSAMIRGRSRSSLTKSRCARTRIADASVIRSAHDLEIRVLEARGMGLDQRERRLDGTEERM